MASTSAEGGDQSRQSVIQKYVVTPLILISFLVSLTLVDYRHSANRSHYHADPRESRIPQWLHRILYRYRKYQYVPVDDKGRPLGESANNEEYYHSYQRKLLRMEVDEAFEIRSTVLVALSLISLLVLWGFYKVIAWGLVLVGWTR